MNKLIFMTALIFGIVYFYKYQLEKCKYQRHIVDIESLEDVVEFRQDKNEWISYFWLIHLFIFINKFNRPILQAIGQLCYNIMYYCVG